MAAQVGERLCLGAGQCGFGNLRSGIIRTQRGDFASRRARIIEWLDEPFAVPACHHHGERARAAF